MHPNTHGRSTTSPLFMDRREAGARLGGAVRALGLLDPLVLGVPPGGVAVAAEVARALGAPLDVWLCTTVAPTGARSAWALGEGGASAERAPLERAPHETAPDAQAISPAHLEQAAARMAATARRLREGRPRPCVSRRDVVVVMDATTSALVPRTVLRDVRDRGARHAVLATPVGTASALHALEGEAHAVVCIFPFEQLSHAGAPYGSSAVNDEASIVALLRAARRRST